ncbi:probably inactive copalyl diphosphate synthase 3-like [Salvia hispanica]|uniref:probably inactive copalyl diphosphate synthase 3-like n=1 Tax=Salvia hispanica TaxID=49212 RepID=UPI0020091499|nr:probably inactive copalyl diphosphate synthase 3-like [Salvia hispanica]
MYILSTGPINSPLGNSHGSISSAQGRRLSSQNRSNENGSWIWKNVRQEIPPHVDNRRIFRKDARGGKLKFNVCSGNIDSFELQPINKIRYGLETPWYARLPRLDARFFIEHYNADEVLIGYSIYKLNDIKKNTYLELAKSDYNTCQEQHQIEWNHLQKWYEDCNLEEFGISRKNILEAHFFVVASISEAERSGERLAWVKSQILAEILSTYYFIKQRDQFKDQDTEFSTAFSTKIHVKGKGYKNVQRIITILFEALTQMKEIARNAQEGIDGDVSDDLLHEAWGGWLKKLGEGTGEEIPEVEVIVRTINVCGGHILSKEVLSHHEYETLSQLTNQLCHHLLKLENHKTIDEEIKKEMELLVQLVMQDSSNGISKATKQMFLMVAKTFYHKAYFSAQEIEHHISRILFEQVV